MTVSEAPARQREQTRARYPDAEGYVERDGVTQPAPAPRFSRTRATLGSRPARPGEHTREALAAWGIDDVDALLAAGAAVQA